jgi:hypothetical protein
MGLKLYLNKFLKVDNIESYTFSELIALKKEYEKVLEESEGTDPDFPMFSFGGAGKKIAGTNIHTLTKHLEDDNEEDSIYGNNSSIVNARNSTVEERALNFLRNVGLKH